MKKLMLLLFIICTVINIHGQAYQKELVRMKVKNPVFSYRLRKMLKAANLVWKNRETVSWCALYIQDEDKEDYNRILCEFRYGKDTLLRGDEFKGYMYIDSVLFLIPNGKGYLTTCKEHKIFTFYPSINECPVVLFFNTSKTSLSNNQLTFRRQKTSQKKQHPRLKAKSK